MSTQTRVQRLRESMKAAGLDAMFVSAPLNVYYLSDFRCRSWSLCQPLNDPEGFVVVEPDRVTFLCDDRYDPSAARKAGFDHGRIAAPAGAANIAAELKRLCRPSWKALGFEAASLLHADAVGLMEALPDVRWKPADELLVRQRIIKDAAELDLLRRAARVTDEAYAHAVKTLRVGMSEADLAGEINHYLRTHSEGLAFDTIVAFGPAAAAPHYHPDPSHKLKKGDLVLMDFGGVVEGYHGDMTRVVFMGRADARQREVYEAVLGAQEACLKGLRAGMTEEAGDALARGYLERKGMADRFIHGTGHGVGLAIHEPPRLKTSFTTVLEPGMVVTVEPGLYYEGWGGVRIEDVAIITKDGIENITRSPKQLTEIAC